VSFVANIEHLEVLKRGVAAWNAWRTENPYTIPDLRNADLASADLKRVVFNDANLHRVNLFNADLRHALLRGAIMGGSTLISANLSGADLSGAHMGRTNLHNSILTGAKLRGVNFYGANLNLTNFGYAELGWTVFADTDLSQAIGLETIQHVGPSSLGIETLYRSQGRVPRPFLQGTGAYGPHLDSFVASLLDADKQREFRSCFISHSSKDAAFCDRFYRDLQMRGVRVWYFPEDAAWGGLVWGEIDRGIKLYDRLIVVCSEQSLQSGPVLREIERALQREDTETSSVLFPIRIDDFLFKSWQHPRKSDLLAKVIGDFRDWDVNASSYTKALDRLLASLARS
jgi:TIR domain/Pentapeptide repeats (8 copies)